MFLLSLFLLKKKSLFEHNILLSVSNTIKKKAYNVALLRKIEWKQNKTPLVVKLSENT